MLIGAMSAAMCQEITMTPYTPYFIDGPEKDGEKTVVFNVLPNGVEGSPQIPTDCVTWTNGCIDCEVKDGEIVNCPAQTCEYSKCLPHCKKFTSDSKPAENCVSWYDGCNRCFFVGKSVLYQSTMTGDSFELRPNADASMAACTRMFCFESNPPKCMKYRTCTVTDEELKLVKE